MPGAPGGGSAAKVICPLAPGKVAQAGDAKSRVAMITAPVKPAPSLNDFMSFPFIYAAGLSLSSARLAWNLLFGPRAAARPHDESGRYPGPWHRRAALGTFFVSSERHDRLSFLRGSACLVPLRIASRACRLPAPPFVAAGTTR